MFELAPFDLPEGYGDEILPLAEAKAHLSIEASETEFDDLVGALRDSAVDMVERYCGVYLASRTGVVWKAECLPARVRLGVRPVTSIDEGAYLDSDGAEQAWDVTTLRLGLRDEVVLKAGESWPSGMDGGIALTFTAGYTDANRPKALVAAVKMFLAHLFANREAVGASGAIGGEIPLGFKALCGAYRIPVI